MVQPSKTYSRDLKRQSGISSNLKGAKTEAIFEAVCCDLGWFSAKPTINSLKFDYVLSFDQGISWETVQVKSGGHRDKGSHVDAEIVYVRHDRGRYNTGDYDWLFTSLRCGCFLIPFDEVGGVNLTFRPGCKWDLWLVAPPVFS